MTLDAKDRPVLYSFRRCPYAMRARMGLVAAGLELEWREVILRDKPAHMVEISPKATVPVVQLPDGTVIEESLDVMKWALGKNDPLGWVPDDEVLAEKVASAITECDWTFKYHLDRYKYPNRYEGADAREHREAALASLTKWDSWLQKTDNLMSHSPTLADYAIFPFVRQFANVDRDWFDAQPISALQRWLASHLASPIFERIMEKRAPWKPDDPVSIFPPENGA